MIGVVSNNAKNTLTENRALFRIVAHTVENYRRCRQQREKFSALWATTWKNNRCCGQQHRIIISTQINILKRPHCKPLKEQ
jgi:hypothetical protein